MIHINKTISWKCLSTSYEHIVYLIEACYVRTQENIERTKQNQKKPQWIECQLYASESPIEKLIIDKIITILQLEQCCLTQDHTVNIRRKHRKQVQKQNLCFAKCIYKHKSLDEIQWKEHSTYMSIWDIFTEAF